MWPRSGRDALAAGKAQRRVVPLTDGEYIVGRAAECSLVIDGTTVSRHHARVTVLFGAATIEDLASTNGTHVAAAHIDDRKNRCSSYENL
jgi:pSer/pThr/pTyr-binding forkhead associated (FHA) protein